MKFRKDSLKLKPPSLKRGLALPFAIASVMAIVTINASNYYDLKIEKERDAVDRAENLAHGISFTAEQLKDQYGLQRVVTAYGAQRDIKQLVVVDKESQKVVASIKREQLGETLGSLADKSEDLDKLKVVNQNITVQNTRALNQDVWAIVPFRVDGWNEKSISVKGDYYVAVLVSTRDTYMVFVREALKDAVVLTLILALLTYFQFWVMKQNIVAPMWHLTGVIQKRKEGDKEILSQISGDSEIGQLSTAMNQMLEQIKQNEVETLNSQLKLAHSAKMASLGEMAGGVAHEINNPLAVIVGKVGVMRRKIESENTMPTPAEILGDINRIESMAIRISKIVKGLRTFSRNGENDPFEEKSIVSIVDDSLELCQEKFTKNGVELFVTKKIDATVSCRAVEVSQVLVNLLNNAYDAALEQQKKWVRFELESLSGNRIIVKITDSGPGIPPEVASKIMQPFYTTKPVGKGTGLGLSISVGIMQAHGGSLRYNSKMPNTCFEVELPARQIAVLPASNVKAA